MSWHDHACKNPSLNWTDDVPVCDTCGSSAASLLSLTDPIEAPPPPPPPDCPKRSQLKLSWPPCVEYSGPFVDEGGNNVTDFLIGNIDRWEDADPGSPGAESHEKSTTKSAGETLPPDNGNDKPSAESDSGDTLERKYCAADDPQARRVQHALGSIYEDIPKPDGFRALLLHGAESFHAPVHCSLEVGQLDDPALFTYEALSYTWADLDGDKRTCMPIFIGPQYQVLHVTRNCQSALRSLRSRHDRVLWVDAICINQHNSLERQSQVGMMKEIYSSAARVLVYLGEERNASGSAMKAVAARSTSNEWDKDALVQLFERSYFRRIWVIQEIALAQKASVTCGDETVHWTSLCSAFQSCELDSSWTNHFSLPKHNQQKPPELLRLLIDTIDSSCADPRDRIFGLIGLVHPDEAELFPIDYSLSVQQLYTGLAAYWANQPKFSSSHEFFLFAGIRKKIFGLPSWVPDWSNLAGHQSVGLTVTFNVTQISIPEPSWGFDAAKPLPVDRETPYGLITFNPTTVGLPLDSDSVHTAKSSRQPSSDELQSQSLTILSDVGSLITHGIHLFRYSQGTLSFAVKYMDGIRIDHLQFDGTPRLLGNEEEFEIFYFPRWLQAFVLKRRADSIFSIEGSFHVDIILPGPNEKDPEARRNTDVSNVLAATYRIVLREQNMMFVWRIAVQFLKERLFQRFRGDFEDGYISDQVFEKHLPEKISEAIRSAIEESPPTNTNQPPIRNTHIKLMEQMRTEMLQTSLNLKDFGKHLFSDMFSHVSQKEFREVASEWTRLDKSPEDQVRSWRQEVTRLGKVLARESLAETLQTLPLKPFHRGRRDFRSYMILNESTVGYASSVALRHMEESSLDDNKSWEWNRDRFWICLVSFDLIARLRELLHNMYILALMESSVRNGSMERVVLI